MQKQIQKILFVSEIVASELAVLKCPDQEESTCHWQ